MNHSHVWSMMKNPLYNHSHMIRGQYCNKAVLDLEEPEFMCYILPCLDPLVSLAAVCRKYNRRPIGMTVYMILSKNSFSLLFINMKVIQVSLSM